MMSTFFKAFLGAVTVLSLTSAVAAETHTIKFDNKCGKGTPTLLVGGKIVSTGKPYTSNGPISSSIAYLQTGQCGYNGEKCTLMEQTLVNPTCPGCGSSADISLIPTHAFNVETSFAFYGGCDGKGAICSSANCNTAFKKPDDNQVQVQCQSNNVNLLITFCGDATKEVKKRALLAGLASGLARRTLDARDAGAALGRRVEHGLRGLYDMYARAERRETEVRRSEELF